MDECTAHLAAYLMDWLEEKGWRRAPYELVTRLAVLVGRDDVVHLDARTSGHRVDYGATIALFTAERLFVQTIAHSRHAREASVRIEVVRRCDMTSLTTTAEDVVALGWLARVCEWLIDHFTRLGPRLEGLCARFVARHRSWARYDEPPPLRAPALVSVRAVYRGLTAPLSLPLDGHERSGVTDEEFHLFLPSLVSDVAPERADDGPAHDDGGQGRPPSPWTTKSAAPAVIDLRHDDWFPAGAAGGYADAPSPAPAVRTRRRHGG